MEDSEISWLIENSDRIIGETEVSYHRALFGHVDWNERLICLRGARGVGKTTLMKQYLKESYGVGNRAALFASLDAFWFETLLQKAGDAFARLEVCRREKKKMGEIMWSTSYREYLKKIMSFWSDYHSQFPFGESQSDASMAVERRCKNGR